MSGGLADFRPTPFALEREVQDLLRRAGESDVSIGACKAWVRALIVAVVPTWTPGAKLSVRDAQRVGEAFETLAASPHPRIADIVPSKGGRPRGRRRLAS